MDTKAETKTRGEVKAITGNIATAHAVRLCKPDVVGIYPVTPASAVAEYLAQFKADGLMDAEIVEVEGETSSMGTLIGASAAGGRTFTATSGAGLAFMFDSLLCPPALRLPMVMVNVNREHNPPLIPVAGFQDIMSVKDAGWVQIHVETVQEILDSIIMAFRLSEDPNILLPIIVSYDGFFLSHLMERVEVPCQEDVDRFLPPASQSNRPALDPEGNFSLFTAAFGEWGMEYRYKHAAALNRVKTRIGEIEEEFKAIFGRSYGGQIEEYRSQDAEIVLLAIGSSVGTAKAIVDKKRDEGLKVGVIKIRLFRPFPRERLAQAVQGKKAIGVIDRSVLYGWNCGDLFMESKTAISDLGYSIPMADFISGICDIDTTLEQVERAVDITYQASQGKPFKEVTWLPLE